MAKITDERLQIITDYFLVNYVGVDVGDCVRELIREHARLKARLALAEAVCEAAEVFKRLPRRFGAERLQASVTLGKRLREWRHARDADEAKGD